MLANRPGDFIAKVTDMNYSKTGANSLDTVTITFYLMEEFVDGEKRSIENEDASITSWTYLSKKDGSANIQAGLKMKDTFGWTGEMNWFNTVAIESLPMARITLGLETYNGKERLKCQWINPADSTPGPQALKREIVPADESDSKWRAILGGKPVKPAPGKPAPVAPKTPPARKLKLVLTEQDVWNDFVKFADKITDAQQLEAIWTRAVDKHGQDWAAVLEAAKKEACPI